MSIGKHAMIDITLNGESNDGIMHHLAEDVAIALAQSIDKALGDRTRITRFGYALIPRMKHLCTYRLTSQAGIHYMCTETHTR